MALRTGKRTALISAALALALLALVGFLLRGALREQWLLRTLQGEEPGASAEAALALARHGSARSLPPLFDLFRQENPWSSEERSSSKLLWIAEEFRGVGLLGEIKGNQAAFQAIAAIHARERRRSVPYLVAELGSGNLWSRYLALELLAELGPAASEAVAAIEVSGKHAHPAIQSVAARAIARIRQSPRATAVQRS